ncbi:MULTISPECIES: AMP-binding protein [Gulosibacter]|uniref:AMP-binding protein n=1 Tax=Gulosibacter TaxID=256818 RepID=UPI0019187B79|nr:AMP-binding protein [Gulosibacter hominis]
MDTAIRKATPAEQELWFAALLASDLSAFSTVHAFDYDTHLPREAVRNAWQQLSKHIPLLGSRFALMTDGPLAERFPGVFSSGQEPPFTSKCVGSAVEFDRVVRDITETGFAPETGPLASATLISRTDTASDTLILAVSHLAVDGYGWSLLLNHLARLIDCELTGSKPPQRPAEPSEAVTSPPADDDLRWWRDNLTSAPLPLTPQLEARQGQPRAIRHLRNEGLRNPALALAAAALAASAMQQSHGLGGGLPTPEPLHRVHLAVPFLSRRPFELRTPMTAMNLVPVVVDVAPVDTLVERCQVILNEAREHQFLRAETARRQVLSHNDSRHPHLVINIIPFTLELRVGNLTAAARILATGPATAPAIAIRSMPGGDVSIETDHPDTPLFDAAAQSSELLNQFVRALQTLTDPNSRESVVAQTSPRVEDLIARFGDVVNRHPHQVAFDEPTRTVSYVQLWNSACALAHELHSAGVGREHRVGVCIDRGSQGAVSILATLMAGAAFVPMPAGEQEASQRARTAEAVSLDALIAPTHSCLDVSAAARFSPPEVTDIISSDSPATPPFPLDDPKLASSLAYVITTSGSTGKPKPVGIERGSLSTWLVGAHEYMQTRRGDRVAQFAPVHFDTSIEELFCSLTEGATLIPRSTMALENIPDWLRACEADGITVLDLPTGYWHELVRAMRAGIARLPSTLRLVVIGGEGVSPARVAEWHECAPSSVELINTYGPTEATVVASWARLSPAVEERHS